MTDSSKPSSARAAANVRAARIGPTVCDDDGPIPIENRSNTLMATPTCNANVGPVIRPAVPEDVPAILALIRELAVYEREPVESVEATEDGLHAVLFGEQPAVWAHVAELDGEVVGTAIWFVSFSTWTGRHGMHLEDFVVSERRAAPASGVALFDELRRICVERGYPRFEWRVLDWNADAERFYERRGARRIPEWISWRLTP